MGNDISSDIYIKFNYPFAP